MDRRVTHLHMNRSVNGVLEVVQCTCICIIIFDQTLLFLLLLCSHFIFFFFVKKIKASFSNPIEVKYLVTVIVYQPTP